MKLGLICPDRTRALIYSYFPRFSYLQAARNVFWFPFISSYYCSWPDKGVVGGSQTSISECICHHLCFCNNIRSWKTVWKERRWKCRGTGAFRLQAILAKGLNFTRLVNLFHLNKRLGRPVTLSSNLSTQAAEQQHYSQDFYRGQGLFYFTCYERYLKSLSTSAFCKWTSLACFYKADTAERKKKHISQASLYLQLINNLFYWTVC